MKRQDILDRLAAHRDELKGRGVKSVALFGSAARDEATDTSDVDLLVEFDRPTGLLALIGLKHRIEEMLQIENVDLLTRDGLHPALKDRILAEAIDVVV
ncbi:MAG: nucleotidyltransferase family protein [Desulfomonilaceae bacterium]